MSFAGDVIEVYRYEHEQIAYGGDYRCHCEQREIGAVVLNQ